MTTDGAGYEIWTRFYNGDGRKLTIPPFTTYEQANRHIESLRRLAASRGVNLGTMTYEIMPAGVDPSRPGPNDWWQRPMQDAGDSVIRGLRF